MRVKIQCLIAMLLAVGVLICPTLAASPFPDVDEEAGYAQAVEYVNAQGIMMGDDLGNFNPDETVTRAEMATIICRMLGETEGLSKTDKFPDVPKNHWANSFIAKAADLKVITGYPNGNYRPGDKVTYEQVVTMIIRAAGGSELAAEYGGYPQGFLKVAAQHGFLEGITAQKGDLLSRKDVSIILLNGANYYFSEDTENYDDGSQVD